MPPSLKWRLNVVGHGRHAVLQKFSGSAKTRQRRSEATYEHGGIDSRGVSMNSSLDDEVTPAIFFLELLTAWNLSKKAAFWNFTTLPLYR